MAEILKLDSAKVKSEEFKKLGSVLIDFWAPWCGPCRMLAPSVEMLAEEYDGKLTVGKINIDEDSDIAMELGIMSIPTLIIFKDGVAVDTLIGAVPYENLKSFVDRNL